MKPGMAAFAVACVVILVLEIAFVLPITSDDAFITFRYGHNLANGFGLVWNTGEPPVEGYTSTLGVLVAALSIKAGVYPLLTAKIVGALCAVGTLLLVLFYGHALRSRERVIASLILLASPDVAYYAASGMENAWALPLIAYLVLRHMDIESFTSGTYVVVSSALVTLCLLRPEGHLVAVAFVAVHTWRAYAGRTSSRKLGLLLAPLVISLAVLHVGRYAWFGDLLPNTYYAKHTGGGTPETLASGLLYLGEGFFAVYGLVWILAIWWVLKARDALSLASLGLLVAFPIYALKVGGDDVSAFAGARLLIPILPLIWVYAGRYIGALPLSRRSFLAGAAAVAVLAVSINAAWYFGLARTLYQVNTLSTAVHARIIAGAWAHARFLRAPNELPLSGYLIGVVPAGEYIAVPWAGRVPYETRLPTIDLLGLNDRRIARQPKRQRGIGVKYDAQYVLSRRPFAICDNVNVRGMRIDDFKAMTDVELLALGAFKPGQRDLLRSPVLAEEYVIDANAPANGCFIRTTQRRG